MHIDAWKDLTDEQAIAALLEASKARPVALFKHSTRCGISHQAKAALEDEWDLDATAIDFYYIDLLRYRSVSNAVAEELGVPHQSPQLIVLKDGAVARHGSHQQISMHFLHQALDK